MAEAAIPLMIAGTVIGSVSDLQEGAQAEAAGKSKARQLTANAKEAEAAGIRKAIEIRRQGERLKGDARAAMAAQGGVTDDVGATRTLADIEQVTDYNSLAALFSGNREAQSLRFASRMARYEGHAARKASYLKAASTALKGGASVYQMSKE